jgi:hypothetical protein
LRELNGAAKIAARRAEVVPVVVAEGATLKWEFYVEPDVIFTSEIGFCIRKKMTVPGGDDEEDTVYYMELPWIGMKQKAAPKPQAKTPQLAKYATGTWVTGVWGPSLQTTEVDLCWDNSHCSMIQKSLDYHIRVVAGDEDEMEEDGLEMSKEDLARFYEKHDPEKVGEISTFLATYSKAILLK